MGSAAVEDWRAAADECLGVEAVGDAFSGNMISNFFFLSALLSSYNFEHICLSHT